jgi:diaminopimelate decarboxylase
VNELGHLVHAGCDVVDLAREFGTPLYVFDEDTIRANCTAYLRAFRGYTEGVMVAYAAKAFLTRAVAAIVGSQGLYMDVVSGGELYVALAGGFPPERVVFHGNNKSDDELRYALDVGVGRIVIDNFNELARLVTLARARGARPRVLLRVAPGIEAHTHHYVRTGSQDSKFGFDLASGQALEAARRCADSGVLDLAGLHAHVGSQLLDTAVVEPLVERVLDLAGGPSGTPARSTCRRPPSPTPSSRRWSQGVVGAGCRCPCWPWNPAGRWSVRRLSRCTGSERRSACPGWCRT